MSNDWSKGLADWQKMSASFWQGIGGMAGAAQADSPSWDQAMNLFDPLFQDKDGKSRVLFEQVMDQGKNYFSWLEQLAKQPGSLPDTEALQALAQQFMGGFKSADPFNRWWEQIQPTLRQFLPDMGDMGPDALKKMLSTPAFGMAREHQERLQSFARAAIDHQTAKQGYQALIAKSMRVGAERMQSKVAALSEPGARAAKTPRALYDLWIDALEESYAEVAMSPEFRTAYGELVNTQMRVKQHLQREVELAGGALGMPGRTEVDSAHRKIAELSRALREQAKALKLLSEQVATLQRDEGKSAPVAKTAATPVPVKAAAPAKPPSKPKAKSAAVRKGAK